MLKNLLHRNNTEKKPHWLWKLLMWFSFFISVALFSCTSAEEEKIFEDNKRLLLEFTKQESLHIRHIHDSDSLSALTQKLDAYLMKTMIAYDSLQSVTDSVVFVNSNLQETHENLQNELTKETKTLQELQDSLYQIQSIL